MVRGAREKSSTGIYHIMLRGIDKRDIFLDDEDRLKFIEKLIKAKEVAEFKLYGYCLMDNHVHLLIGETEEIGTSIKRITVGYVQWHNKKYERTGHLFQNRFLSEVVESEAYLINVLRYIHQNPVKAKISKMAKNYQWSSYNDYIYTYRGEDSFIDAEMIKAYFSKFKDFEDFMETQTEDEYLEYRVDKKISDTALKGIVDKEIKISKLMAMPIAERNRKIKELYIQTGASVRQLERVLGIGRSIISKAIK